MDNTVMDLQWKLENGFDRKINPRTLSGRIKITLGDVLS